MQDLTILRYIEGWRFWKLVGEWAADQFRLALESIAYAYAWPPREPARATCDYCWPHTSCGAHARGEMAVHNCAGGLYGYKSKQVALDIGLSDCGEDAILGRVALWGQVIEHQHGFRAQYAYPLSLNESRCWGCRKALSPDQAYLLVTNEAILSSCPQCSSYFRRFKSKCGMQNMVCQILSPRYAFLNACTHKHLEEPGWHSNLLTRYAIP